MLSNKNKNKINKYIHNEKMSLARSNELVIRPLILSTWIHVQYVLATFPNYR